MDIALQKHLQTHQQHLLRLKNSVEQLNPQAVLARGFAIVQNRRGELVKNSQQLQINEQVNITLGQGSASASIFHIDGSK